jgi:signal transduction histidine kinase
MEEVASTASTVGRATLQTFEAAIPPATDAAGRTVHTWVAVTARHDIASDPSAPTVTREVKQLTLSGTEAGDIEEIRRLLAAEGCSSVPLPPAPDGAERVQEMRFVVDVDRVTAEPDPVRGLILRIPGVQRQQAYELAIPVEDYETLFASLRRRSSFLFLGVFVVGTALSAGLAARFTRPVRRLDGAIRSLSAGDLDVRVDVEGKGEIARLAGAFNEMAGKLRANRERERDLVRREKLSALGRLAAGVAHDVRNPLHSINLTLEHLQEAARPEDGERSAEFDRAVVVIRDEIRRLDRLVGNFLRFANGEREARQSVSLADVLTETARLVGKEAEWRKVEVRLDLDPASRAVTGDSEALRSAILNLVLNGFDAMPAGGTISLRLRNAPGHAVIEVEDTGEGIPEADRERVFEFSYTTREGGSGLGLAMVHHWVVEEHGGRVSVHGGPEGGTCVRIELPFDGAAA